MVKVYKSGAFVHEFTGTRADAIKQCAKLLAQKAANTDNRGRTYRWDADDGSGFLYEITTSGEVKLVRKINAERKF